MAARTTIMITHDLTLAPDADRILVIDRGRLVEAGTHTDLLARNGPYTALARPLSRSAGPGNGAVWWSSTTGVRR
ncbi:hypothetical protein [Streptomyces sp. NPDC094468]|uniref:hypothetical protein n=1 Tax=Streptomyces sp. NPDC094468 TaxID=3366066 RepID=UPI0038013CF3